MATTLLLTGDQNEGKTTKLLHIYSELKKLEIPVLGFAAPGIWDNDKKIGFNMLDLKTNKTLLLATIIPNKNYFRLGRFYFNPEAIAHGNQIISKILSKSPHIIFIDEIGKFELQGSVWHHPYQKLIKNSNHCVLTVVRGGLIDQIKAKYHLKNSIDYNLETSDKIIINRLLNFQSKNFNS